MNETTTHPLFTTSGTGTVSGTASNLYSGTGLSGYSGTSILTIAD